MASVIAFSACGGNGENSAVSSPLDVLGNLTGSAKATVEEDPDAPDRDNTPLVLKNIADGSSFFEGNGATVDYSNAKDGYIMAKYEGDNPKIKLQITKGDGPTYTYNVATDAEYHSFPLSLGSGAYNIAMFLNIEGDQYSQACAETVDVDIADGFSPFLRPNQFSNFTSATQAVAKGTEIAQGAKTDLKVIENAFLWATQNIAYDYEKAATVQQGYLPDIDATLASGEGICFDYAALMVCFLRSQRIPCQLVVGYAGPAYHAWISVYVDGVGWVANMIQFTADTWTLMDPTFAAGGDRADPNMIGDGENYNPVYHY